MKINQFFIILFVFCFLLIIGCDSSTKTQKGVISGVITLDGQVVHSGVTVLLYKADIISEDIQITNDLYPQTGFTVKEKHIFDHRDFQPLNEVLTSATGTFTFNDVPYGKYILAYYKDGWGYNYLFDVELSGKQLEINDGVLHLYPITLLQSAIIGEYHLEENKCYFTENNVSFLPESILIIERGSKLLVKPGCNITVYCDISIMGDDTEYVTITSSDCIYSEQKIVNQFSKFEISQASICESIGYMILTHCTEGLVVLNNNLVIHNSFFHNNYKNFQIIGGGNTNNVFSNNIIVSEVGSNQYGVYLNGTVNPNISKNRFINIDNALTIRATENAQVFKNVFQGGANHIYSTSISTSIISYNTFKNANYAITNTAKSNMTIQSNDIQAKICVYTFHTGNMGNTITQGWTKGNQNNFYGTEYAIDAEGYFSNYDFDYIELDFTNNFWNATNSQSIEDLIKDMDEINIPDLPGHAAPKIIYIPFRLTPFPNAGCNG